MNIMKKLMVVVLFVAIGLGMNSCKKYDEGPMLSFRSKTARLVNVWVVSKVVSSDVDVTDQYKDEVRTFNEDGTYTLEENSTTENATWAFDEKKEAIILTEATAGTQEVLNILMLKNKELTFEQTVMTETFTYYLVQKPE